MRQPDSDLTTLASPAVDPRALYEEYRARVDAGHLRMRAVSAAPHPPAEARQAAAELTATLRAATDIVLQALRLAQPAPIRPRRWGPRRKATRAVPAAVSPWSAELMRLSEIGVWLRRTTLDDPGVHLPATVRIGSYAANGPHIAGLDFGTDDAAMLSEPRIGVDLQQIIDGVGGSGAAARRDGG